ncbi:MAG: sn-glycerol-3-phosphate ABC transporter ATP-binding protein UgpC [Kiritimatiellia bacterium]|nr:sn-glycerol-3-phosphate ABC transporter ATP-binding protein UgpC [Kiritimatiellia bacterium]
MARVMLENVWKKYPGNVTAVRDFNLEIPDKEFIIFVGPSGCGKSTTLRMIAGLEEITRGTIRIGEKIVNEIPPKDRDIAMVFQNYALYPHMTVYNNLAFGLKLRAVPRREIQSRVESAAKDLGIADFLARRPSALSGGQRQRVALGRAIVRNPAVFLFDEPLSNLDAKMRVEMRRMLMHLHKRLNTTMIYVTHDQVEAMTLGDRIVVMKDGLALQVAEPLTVYRYPADTFVAKFIGTPPMNLFPGKIVRDGSGYIFDGETFQLRLPERMIKNVKDCEKRDVFFGIRPEALVQKEMFPGQTDGVIRGNVDVNEKLGNEVIVHIISGRHNFQMRMDSGLFHTLKPQIDVCPKMDHAHIFDGETGLNLTIPESAGATPHASELKPSNLNSEED